MGFNPAWRNSLAFVVIGTTWRDGADLTEIEATRQILIQGMRILEEIAPESGAYFNEVRVPCLFTVPRLSYSLFVACAGRHRDMNSTGRNRSSGLTTTSSEPSSRSTIQIRFSSFTKVSDQTSGTQISSVESEAASKYRTHWGRLSEELGSGMRSSSLTVYDSRVVSGP